MAKISGHEDVNGNGKNLAKLRKDIKLYVVLVSKTDKTSENNEISV